MELKKINDLVYYIPNPANIGIIKDGEKSAILIDTGLDDETENKFSDDEIDFMLIIV